MTYQATPSPHLGPLRSACNDGAAAIFDAVHAIPLDDTPWLLSDMLLPNSGWWHKSSTHSMASRILGLWYMLARQPEPEPYLAGALTRTHETMLAVWVSCPDFMDGFSRLRREWQPQIARVIPMDIWLDEPEQFERVLPPKESDRLPWIPLDPHLVQANRKVLQHHCPHLYRHLDLLLAEHEWLPARIASLAAGLWMAQTTSTALDLPTLASEP
jgi:hypothetical protein